MKKIVLILLSLFSFYVPADEAKDTKISSGVLDPLGATLDSGKTLYFDLIKNISLSIKNC